MVDMDWKMKMGSSDVPKKPNKLQITIPTALKLSNPSPVLCPDPTACSAYEHYFRLPELRKIWTTTEFPDWKTESILKPALQALEITFRLISIVFSDPRPYTNHHQWTRRLESLATTQIQLIASICEDEEFDETVPIAGVGSSPTGVISKNGSSVQVWSLAGGEKASVVNYTSETSLLPRLASWKKSEETAEKIQYSIECEMRRCRYTLGLGEPNLAGKPSISYDAVCKPSDLHELKKNPYSDIIENHENQILYTTHQILESWIHTSRSLIDRIESRIGEKQFKAASQDCYVVEKIWKLLSEIEDLHLLMDPEDFLRLKKQLQIKSVSQNDAFCFRSKGLVEITKLSKGIKHKVPYILGVDVDPTKIQEAAIGLYGGKREFEKIHLLQGMQAIEAALKQFFFAYKQVVGVVMGSVEANVNVAVANSDSLSRIFLEPAYYPSLEAAKTFFG